MELYTTGREYNPGKIAQIRCVSPEFLRRIDIRGKCFLLLLLEEGAAAFRAGGREFSAEAPCFVCFGERENPVLLAEKHLKCQAICFHPQFLNVNITFELIRSDFYGDIAHTHDMFLLKPFLEERFVVPVSAGYLGKLLDAYAHMKADLEEQRDWYWSCRARSYFMEIIICLERFYGMLQRGEHPSGEEVGAHIENERLKKAVLFIERAYAEDIGLRDIVASAKTNRTTLGKLFDRAFGMSPVEYLWGYRIRIAKKHLAFTEVPVKDISERCGFKSVPHFTRMFKSRTGQTPRQFRGAALARRRGGAGSAPIGRFAARPD